MLGKMNIPGWQPLECSVFADGHTASNAPDLFRPPKLSGAGPGQYWGGGPPGKPLGCCQLLVFSFPSALYVCVCLCVCAILRAPVTSQLLWPCLPRISHYSPGISKTKQNQARWLPWERTCVAEKGLRDRNSPTCTLSQNGYGDEAVWLLEFGTSCTLASPSIWEQMLCKLRN